MLGGADAALTTLGLVPPPPARHLLQEESPPPPTAAAELVDGVGALSVQPPWRLFASNLPIKRSGPVACLLLTHLQHSHCVCTRGHLPAQLQQPPLDALDLCCRSRRLARAWLGDCWVPALASQAASQASAGATSCRARPPLPRCRHSWWEPPPRQATPCWAAQMQRSHHWGWCPLPRPVEHLAQRGGHGGNWCLGVVR